MKSIRFSVSLHNSLWPSLTGLALWGLVTRLLLLLKCSIISLLLLSSSFSLTIIWLLSMDMCYEARRGEYSFHTLDNLKFRLCLFVLREVILFFAFFWSYFHYSFSPSIFTGGSWPPFGILLINPIGIPLFRTLLLIRRGISITWRHHLTITGKRIERLYSLSSTILLGSLFLVNQFIEFTQAPFTLRDSVLGSIFFTLTGLHGFHVIVGTFLLAVRGIRLYSLHFRAITHTFYELSIWYWHLVDCVWLLVYTLLYWWGR